MVKTEESLSEGNVTDSGRSSTAGSPVGHVRVIMNGPFGEDGDHSDEENENDASMPSFADAAGTITRGRTSHRQEVSTTLPEKRTPSNVDTEGAQRHQKMKKVARLLVDMMGQFYGCSAEEHERQIEDLKEDLEDARMEGGSPVYGLDDMTFLTEATLGRQCSKIFQEGEMLSMETVPTMGPSDWRSLNRGIKLGGQSNTTPPVISLELSQPDDVRHLEGLGEGPSPRVAFDIDSIVGLPSSLRVARRGMHINFFPQYVRNIQQDLHIKLETDDLNRPMKPRIKVKIHQIPHFQLGTIMGGLEIPIYVFVPGLFQRDRPTNFPTEVQLARFYDSLFIPAIYTSGRTDQLQHLPSSFAMARRNAQASSSEGLAKNTSYRVQGLQ